MTVIESTFLFYVIVVSFKRFFSFVEPIFIVYIDLFKTWNQKHSRHFFILKCLPIIISSIIQC